MSTAPLSFDSGSHRTGSLYGSFAFGVVILSCFSGFYFYRPQFHMPEWTVPVVFGLGAIYAALGILGGPFFECGRPARLALYYVLQCAVLTGLLFLSPLRGFFGIIVLPLVSQSLFALRPRHAVLVCTYLFVANVAVWGLPYGWNAALQAVLSYSAGFAFTIVFTLITRQALVAREQSEMLRRELEVANDKLRAYAAQAGELATIRERNRVAREIHDGVGHYLTVIKTQLDAAAALCDSDRTRARSSVEKAAKLAAEALDDVRHSVGSLRTDITRPPLPDAVRQLAAHGEPPVTVAIEGTPRPLTPAVEHALYRAAQEGLTNIRKHARATQALLVLDYRAESNVRLELSDNGGGAASTPADGTRFGLTGLRERIELLGGCVETANRLEGGFTLRVEVPA